MLRSALLCLGILVFTWLGFQFFPGHTYLQSDTQIYLPILERLDEPGYLSRDLVATRPHVSYTIYDEVALSLRHTPELDFEKVLVGQQLLFRFLGFLGIYLFATAAGLSGVEAFLASALLHLGGALLGPAVLVVEYEPVPRAFALSLIFLSLGLFAHRLPLLAGLSAGLAFLYHPPTAIPFWGIVMMAYVFDRQIRPLARPTFVALIVAVLLLANLAQLQPGVVEQQRLFGHLSPTLAAIQHVRTRYVWVSLWAAHDIWSYLALYVCCVWATTRIWDSIDRQARWFFVVLPFVGVMSVPVSFVLLERLGLAVIPELQPARLLVFTVVCASLACAFAGIRAARDRRRLEAFLWFLPVVAIPFKACVLDLFALTSRTAVRQFLLWLVLAASLAWLLSVSGQRWRPVLRTCALAVPVLAMFLLPLAGVSNYPHIDKQPVEQVARWAEANTWGSSVFLFPDAGHALTPGIFRALSRRALWVDWKSGGQANYFESLGREWWSRWEQTMDGPFTAVRLQGMLDLPIDYYVLKQSNRLASIKPTFENQAYVVYDARDLKNSSTSLRKGTED
jgi:hypothetical protein